MFDHKNSRDSIRNVKSIKKNLPYSITPIGGIEELKWWKAAEAQKEIEWQQKKEVRRLEAINAFNRGVSTYEGQVSKTTQVYKKHQEYIESCLAPVHQPKAAPKLSPLRIMMDKFLEWFTNFKF